MRLGSGSVMVRQRASFYSRTTNLYVDSQTTSPVGGRILILLFTFSCHSRFSNGAFCFQEAFDFFLARGAEPATKLLTICRKSGLLPMCCDFGRVGASCCGDPVVRKTFRILLGARGGRPLLFKIP